MKFQGKKPMVLQQRTSIPDLTNYFILKEISFGKTLAFRREVTFVYLAENLSTKLILSCLFLRVRINEEVLCFC